MKVSDPGIRSTAMALMEGGNYREAETLLKPMIREFPQDASAACLLAECYAQFQNLEGAEFWYRRALSLQPYNPEYSIRYNRFRIGNLQALPNDRPKYLLGPIMGAAYSFANFADCVFFGGPSSSHHFSEVEASTGENIESILGKCPNGFVPDKIICLLPEYYSPPANIEKCGIQTIGIYTDLPAHSEMIALTAPLFNICLTQGFTQGPQMLIKLGAKGAGTGFFIGDDPLFWVDRNRKRDIDILFLSTFSLPFIYNDRNELILKILSLSSKYKVVIGSESQSNSADLSSRAKIIINCSHSGRLASEMIARRIFESMSSGALSFAEDNIEVVKKFYQDKSEIVLYNKNSIVMLLDNYLNSDDERRRIADAGKCKTIARHTYAGNIKAICHLLEADSGLISSPEIKQIPRAANLLRRGTALFQSLQPKKWDALASLFSEAAEQDPNFEGIIHNNLGVLAAHQGDYPKAEELFAKAIEHSGPHPIFIANRILNSIYLRKDFKSAGLLPRTEILDGLKEAIDILPIYLVCDSNGVIPTDRITRSIYYLKFQDAYLEFPERDDRFHARVISIAGAEINKAFGFGYESMGDFNGAVRHYEMAASEYADDFELISSLSRCCHKLGDEQKALEYIRRAHKLQPLNMGILSNYYALMFAAKHYAEIYESADLMLKADLRINESVELIKLYKTAAAERMNHPHTRELINEYLKSGPLNGSELVTSDEIILQAMKRWKTASMQR